MPCNSIRPTTLIPLAGILVLLASGCEQIATDIEQSVPVGDTILVSDSTAMWLQIAAAESDLSTQAYENYESIPIFAGQRAYLEVTDVMTARCEVVDVVGVINKDTVFSGLGGCGGDPPEEDGLGRSTILGPVAADGTLTFRIATMNGDGGSIVSGAHPDYTLSLWDYPNSDTDDIVLSVKLRDDPGPCGNEGDVMAHEYDSLGINLRPACSDFTTGGDTTHFTFAELNDNWSDGNPHTDWGMVTTMLKGSLERTRANYNRGGIRITSGYRCPHGNLSDAVKGSPTSWHMHGRAADMYSADHNWTRREFDLLWEAARLTAPVEITDWGAYDDDHLHAAW